MSSGYIAPLSANVERTHVRYSNRYGITIAADIYTAKDLDRSKRRPALIEGERAHSKFFSEDTYAAAQEPKELSIVEVAEHIDLHDRTDSIPFDKLEDFFESA